MDLLKTFKKASILPQGIRYKLLIAFSLMSIIPLLVIGFLVSSYVFVEEEPSLTQISVILLLCMIITWLGLFLAKNIIERVVDISLETKIITEGNYEKRIHVDTGDEVGQIGEAINFLTKKIRNNITDLKDYQGKMKEINLDIQKKVSVLSNLLQIGELISSSVKLENILELVLSKLSQFYEGGFSAIYISTSPDEKLTLKASSNMGRNGLLDIDVVEVGEGVLGGVVQMKKQLVIDSSSRLSSKEQAFKTKYKIENMIVFPVHISRWAKILLVVGNAESNFTYTNEDIELVKVFIEQISIAVENDVLVKKADKLEIKDGLTGLFNKRYIVNRLGEEIERSLVSQRPCAFILFDMDGFKDYEKKRGPAQGEIALTKIARVIDGSTPPLGKIGRVERDTFAFVLPEINKKEALKIAESLIKKIADLSLSAEKDDKLTASAGLSENPLDGSNSVEIYQKAEEALFSAKKKGKNQVAYAGG